MKSIVILLILGQVLSSCFTNKNLTKHEPITHDLLTKLKPGRKYTFQLKLGVKQVVKVTQVKDSIITGLIYEKNDKGKKTWSDYSVTFDSVEKDVAKISVLKLNPFLTSAAIVVSVYCTLYIFALAYIDAYGAL